MTPRLRDEMRRPTLSSLSTGELVMLLHDVQRELEVRNSTLDVESSVLFAAAVAHWNPTPRQCEVLQGLIDGMSNKEIAKLSGCSYRTVEIHVTALLQKAAVDTRARLVAKARVLAGGSVRPPPRSDTVLRR